MRWLENRNYSASYGELKQAVSAWILMRRKSSFDLKIADIAGKEASRRAMSRSPSMERG
jgi:hypothetical protein